MKDGLIVVLMRFGTDRVNDDGLGVLLPSFRDSLAVIKQIKKKVP